MLNSTKASIFFQLSETKDLAKQSKRNVSINLGVQACRFCIQIGSTILFSRLLSPEDFGLIGIAMIAIGLVGLFKDAGLAQATIQQEEISHEQVSTLFWINLFIGASLSVTIIVFAPVTASFFNDSRLTKLTAVLALPTLISSLGLQHRALLLRSMKFGVIAVIDLVALAAGFLSGVIAAVAGYGYWSLVLVSIISVLVETLGAFATTRWKPAKPKRGTGVRSMVKFGIGLTGSSLVNYFSRTSDNFLIGKFAGATSLGIYTRAYGLMLMPIRQLNGPISAALLPSLSQLQSNPIAFQDLFLKFSKLLAWATVIPIALGSWCGEELVVYVLGNIWRESGQVFEWLAIASLFQPLAIMTHLVLVSLGQSGKLFRLNLVVAVVTVSCFCVGIPYGVLGIAISYACSSLAVVPFTFWYSLRQSPISISNFISSVRYPSAIGLLIVLLRLGINFV